MAALLTQERQAVGESDVETEPRRAAAQVKTGIQREPLLATESPQRRETQGQLGRLVLYPYGGSRRARGRRSARFWHGGVLVGRRSGALAQHDLTEDVGGQGLLHLRSPQGPLPVHRCQLQHAILRADCTFCSINNNLDHDLGAKTVTTPLVTSRFCSNHGGNSRQSECSGHAWVHRVYALEHYTFWHNVVLPWNSSADMKRWNASRAFAGGAKAAWRS